MHTQISHRFMLIFPTVSNK